MHSMQHTARTPRQDTHSRCVHLLILLTLVLARTCRSSRSESISKRKARWRTRWTRLRGMRCGSSASSTRLRARAPSLSATKQSFKTPRRTSRAQAPQPLAEARRLSSSIPSALETSCTNQTAHKLPSASSSRPPRCAASTGWLGRPAAVSVCVSYYRLLCVSCLHVYLCGTNASI